ncbi:FAD binding domain-containing protein [Bradyrhizobium sp. RDT10]
MKPAPFEYIRPTSLADACERLAADDDARVIAGGQTLIPMLAMRLARPTILVDILRLNELRGIREEGGAIVVGAVTRQVEVERSVIVGRALPLLAKALPWVGHPPTRNRGTVGGSIANADPSAEIPLVAVTLGAEIEIANSSGRTSSSADDFFIGPMLTSVMPGDCVCAIRFPVWSHRYIGTGFREVSARQSDFAFVAAAAQLALDDEGRCLEATLGFGGIGDRPIRVDMSPLIGERATDALISDVVRAATQDLDTSSDLHATADYRRRAAAALGLQAIKDGLAEAQKASGAIQ